MSAPATPLPHRSALPSPAAPSLSDPAVSSSVHTAGKSPASAAGSRAGAAAPGVRSAAASAVNGNPSAHESARSQDEAGKLLYSEAAHNPMLCTRPQTPAHSSSEASIEMAASSPRERHLRPISTDFDSAAAVVKSESDVAPPSTGLIDQSHLSASDPTYVPSYFDLSGSGVSAGSLATPHSDSLSPTQMTPKHGSEGAATLPQTPASATFPFAYGYSVAAPTAVPSGEYAMSVPSLNQAGPTVYNSALDSVESNHSAYGYNLAAYPQTVDYGMSKEYVSRNSLGLAMGIGSTMAQQAMNTFNQQFIASSNWSTQPSTTTYVAPATIQPSPERNAVRSASPLQALSPTPSDSDDESENNAPYGIQPLSAPANASGGFAAQQDMSTFDASGSARSGRRSTLHGSQIRPQASQQASPAPRRSTRRRSSVGVSLGSAGGAATSFSDGTFSGRRKHLTLDEDERERYEREAFERDEWRLKEMEEFEHGPLRGNRKERRRMQNRLAQRSFRARSKIQNQEAINHMQHLEALTEAQQTRLTRMQELMERLQRENAALKSERWAVIQQAGALGVKMPEGLGNFSVGPTTVDTATAHGDDHRGHHSFHLHAATFGLATMEA